MDKLNWKAIFCLLFQIQRSLQMRIEEQGKQLKILFDQQQKTNKEQHPLKSIQNMEVTPQDDSPFSLEDVQVSITENSGNTHFPSKIS